MTAQGTSVSRMLSALALGCAAGALTTRGLSSGLGQALETPGSVLVLDALGGIAALAALGARFLSREPGLVPGSGLLAPIAAFLGLSFLGALHGANGAWRTAFSWSMLVALGLAIRDLSRRKDLARELAGVVAGVATASAVLGLYDFYFEFPAIRAMVEKAGNKLPAEWRFRVSDPMAVGPYLLPSHFACALGMVVPLVLLVLVSSVRRKWRKESVGALLVLLALVWGIVLAKSKGATLALMVALVAFFALAGLAPPWRRRLVGLGAAALVLSFVVGAVKYVRHPDDFGVGNSASVRFEYWQAALSMARERPLVGNGLECYAELQASHKTARAEEAKHAHEDALELLAELGVLGPLAFFWLIVALARAGLVALHTQGPRLPPPHDPPFLPGATCTIGVALGAIVLSGHGDVYDASRAWFLVAGAAIAVLVSRLVSRALADPKWAHAGAAAALAGSLVFVIDGFTDFPLRVHGLVAFALALAFLAPALAEGSTAPPPAGRLVRLAIALTLVGLLVFGLLRVREDTAADVLRAQAREVVGGALELLKSGKTLTAPEKDNCVKALEEGAGTYRLLLDSNELGVPDILLLADSQEAHDQLAHDQHLLDGIRLELADALHLYPRSRELWAFLGRLQGDVNLREDATRSFDAAARCYPAHPATRLAAGKIRVARLEKGETAPDLQARAIHELRAALACANASRLDRLHLSKAEVAEAQRLLVSLGEAPDPPGSGEPDPPYPP